MGNQEEECHREGERGVWILDVSVRQNGQLSGTLPPQLGDMLSLEALLTQNTKISGTLPQSMGKLTKLQSLQSQTSRLSGTLSAVVTFRRNRRV